jgi:hypothetical protein
VVKNTAWGGSALVAADQGRREAFDVRGSFTRVSLRTVSCFAVLAALGLVIAGSAGAATVTSWVGGKASVPQVVTAAGNCPGTVIMITGSGFQTDGGPVSVTIGGSASPQVIVGADQYVYAVVGNSAQSGPVVVTTSKGSVTAPGGNAIVYPCQSTGVAGEKPAVDSHSPSSIKAGGKLTINGVGFVGTKTVTVGGEAANYSIPSDNLMYVRIPKDAKSGPIDIVITNTLGTVKTSVTVK